MHLYACPVCNSRLFFENDHCMACGAETVFDLARNRMLPRRAPPPSGGPSDRSCANREGAGCNWSATPGQRYCPSCATTRTIPDLTLAQNRSYWRAAEAAKRWVLWGLMRLGWFGPGDAGPLPVFDMVAEETSGGPVSVVMGHASGVITLNVSEADPARLALRRTELGEPYRTVMGHVRHELAHYLHWRLVEEDARFAQAFRALFGDERADYAEALRRHYTAPGAAGDAHISSYATAHPHEDWAETTAHVLHLLDIADSFGATGFRTEVQDRWSGDAYRSAAPEAVIDRAAEIGLGMNHVNRAMGLSDLYPFVIAGGVRSKLEFALHALRR
ncbi:putative zinc-binding metallopeptidase [Rhodobacteraceae bacterium 2376]|uniref:Putative zinc-binding metallopeptidase n=1 Tax=Rhabdonatronobacter sediminivivens TaxID=2743469 RepID=A0A7Z0I233_9RHOB|nr:putative zinc-binding metallopeptidase [Rhabdonatronobacter sediminivivens]NYS26547.1 putative zinc-binding metallopeptidase [Rhabdonatronobacter sediminivivens]